MLESEAGLGLIQLIAQFCTHTRIQKLHNRPGLMVFFKGLQGNMENSMSRFIYDLGFLLLHPTPQMLHALNSVSGSLWHFQPQPQQRGMWRSSWGLDPALPLHPAELLTTPVEPSSAETSLV